MCPCDFRIPVIGLDNVNHLIIYFELCLIGTIQPIIKRNIFFLKLILIDPVIK